MIRHVSVLMLISIATAFSGSVFAQDTTGGSDQSGSTNSASTSGNSTTTDPGQTAQNSLGSPNVIPISPAQLAAVQQQQQLTLQFMQQLPGASPDDQVAIIAAYRQELDTLRASVAPPPLTPDQQAQINAQQQTIQQENLQLLPAAVQLAASALQQRQQLAAQLATATADQKVAIVAQIQQLVVPQAQTLPVQTGSLSTDSSSGAITQAPVLATAPLSADQQSVLQAMAQRQEAIQAAMQLSPDEQAAALQTIMAQPLPNSTGNTTGNPAPSPPASSSSPAQ